MVVANRGEGDKAFAGFFGCSVSPAISSGSTLFQLHYDSRSSYDDTVLFTFAPPPKQTTVIMKTWGLIKIMGPFGGCIIIYSL